MFVEEKKNNQIDDNRSTSIIDDGRSTAVVDDGRSTSVVDDGRSTTPIDGDDSSDSPNHIIDLTGEEIDGYHIESRLGGDTSGQSQLYLATKDGKEYAFKLYKRGFAFQPEVLDFLKNNKHENIIKILHDGLFNNQKYLIMDYYKNGSVTNNFDRFKDAAQNDLLFKKFFRQYVEQLNEALNNIHSHKIFHWDIKPANILVSDDFKKLVITDFGSARYSPTGEEIDVFNKKKSVTEAYVAPEGVSHLSAKVDYYALGVTIMEMAHGDYVVGDLHSNQDASWFIPDNVRVEIAALVEKLREFAEFRIGYREVKKWIENPSIYSISGKHLEPNKLSRYYINLAGRKVDNFGIAKDTGDFVKIMQKNWDNSRALFESGAIIYLLDNASDWDGEKDEYFKNLIKDYHKNLDLGLAFMFLKLDPDSEFVYKGVNYHDLDTYLKEHLGKNINEFFNYDYLHARVVAEGHSLLSTIEGIHAKAIQPQNANKYGTDNYEVVSWFNLCSGNKVAFVDNKKKEVLSNFNEIENYLFDEALNAASLDFVFSQDFLQVLIDKNLFEDEMVLKLKNIWFLNDHFVRNGKLAHLLTNEIRFKLSGITIGNIEQLKAMITNSLGDKAKYQKIANLIKSGKLAKWYELFPSAFVNQDILKFLKTSAGSTRDDLQLVITFNNKLSDNKSFMYENHIFTTMQDIFNYLASAPDLQEACQKLIKNQDFLAWLDAMGFTDAKDEIFKIK